MFKSGPFDSLKPSQQLPIRPRCSSRLGAQEFRKELKRSKNGALISARAKSRTLVPTKDESPTPNSLYIRPSPPARSSVAYTNVERLHAFSATQLLYLSYVLYSESHFHRVYYTSHTRHRRPRPHRTRKRSFCGRLVNG
jgi:hypothetical protein